jgi:CBS domain-containing protein
MVMGSEGRGEQILKTDQDNAVLLRDGFEHPALKDVTAHFSATLLRFGYPPCPGNIMVTNPLWCQDIANFRQTVTRWIFSGDADGKMNLAIFMDARAVAGDASLLADVRQHMLALASNEIGFLSRMASAIDQFQEPGSNWWNRLPLLANREPETFDLKKIGSFPIVHGVRALALQFRLEALSTTERLHALVNRQVLPAALGRDLEETLHLLMALKLRNNLRQRALGQDIGNLVELSSLGALDRDQLKEALSIIRQFKQFLRVHYRLEA